jgi:flagellar FliL protein
MADKKAEKKEEPKADDKALAAKKAEGGAEGAPAEGEGAEGAAPKSKKKLIIIAAVAAVLLLGGGGAAAYFLGALDGVLGKKPDCAKVKEGEKGYEDCKKAAAKEAAGGAPGVFVDIPDLIVNLNGNSKQPHFLKITIKVELETKEDEKPFTEIMPRVIDQFQTYLRELRLEDLRGSAGLYRMKLELLNRVRAAAPDVKVRDVLFQEILVQ